ncbi:outer membrane beta-barrel family protein [Aridibaculum aurantiacum]|uniref:outer membrane beta-barrel family protein n=1 Tax=Aridibaculum aurantiacum TaxID=2810307 RepID=UPI001A966589|nr:outer membrane beta-barrel family protein [Aridibaculum aurantiacum]
MKKLIAILLVLVMSANSYIANAQTGSYKVSGRGLSKGTGIENISVTLLKAADYSVVKIEITNKQGGFMFTNVTPGVYLVKLTGVGVQEQSSNPFTVADKDVELPTIELQQQTKKLADVVVTARKPYVEMKADKMVVNVEAAPSNAGSTALEVLEKAPGVTVDREGNISLKGKQGVQVYIDGKPSFISGSDLANMLKGMTASELDQIEIMTNPPAKYDAAGNSGIINIKTKKSRTVGINGSVNASYGQGVYPKVNGGYNLNYRNKKFNLYTSGNYAYRGNFQEFSVSRNILNKQTNAIDFIFRQRTFMPETRNSMNGKIGIDYDFSKNTSASASVTAFNTKMDYNAQSVNEIFDRVGDLQTVNYGRTHMIPNVTNIRSNLNLTHKLDSAGTELVFDADYISYNDKHKQRFYNSFFDGNHTPLGKADTIFGYLPTGFDVYAAKIDFSKPFSNKSKLEVGGKVSYVNSDNDIRFDTIYYGNSVLDVKRSNHFIYQENVYAGYVNFNTPLSKKLSVQTGLRYEYTHGRGRSVTRNSTFTNKYGKLFPTVYFSYAANDKNNFNLNYGRRITRPQYRDLNPFIFIIDQYTSQQGNPYLQPQFSHNIEFSHSYKNAITTTLHYTQVDNAISEVVEPTPGTREVTLIKKNIASLKQFGLAVNINKPLNKWLTVVSNNIVFHNSFKGRVGETDVDNKAISANFYAALQFKLQKGWDAEINGWYNTRSAEGVSRSGSMGVFNLAASKSVLQNKGKITLNVRDPFYIQKYNGYTKFSTVDATINSQWDNRVTSLSFTYRFGKTFAQKKRSTGSAMEEQNRIGG